VQTTPFEWALTQDQEAQRGGFHDWSEDTYKSHFIVEGGEVTAMRWIHESEMYTDGGLFKRDR